MKKCKQCHKEFTPQRPLQYVCSFACSIEYSKALNAKKVAKKWKKEKAELKINTHSKEYRNQLQNEINKLARMIDASFGYLCIDCNKPFGKQTDAAHFHSRGAHSSLRWNLHNLHSARSNCNQWSDTHKEGYKKGITKRYGAEYMKYIESLILKDKDVKLSNREVYDKLKIVRKLIRTFDTYKLIDGRSAREVFNKLIGVY